MVVSSVATYKRTTYSNFLFVECAVDPKHIHRERWRIDWRSIATKPLIVIHRKGCKVKGKQDKYYRYNVIIVDSYVTKEDFIKTLKRHFRPINNIFWHPNS